MRKVTYYLFFPIGAIFFAITAKNWKYYPLYWNMFLFSQRIQKASLIITYVESAEFTSARSLADRNCTGMHVAKDRKTTQQGASTTEPGGGSAVAKYSSYYNCFADLRLWFQSKAPSGRTREDIINEGAQVAALTVTAMAVAKLKGLSYFTTAGGYEVAANVKKIDEIKPMAVGVGFVIAIGLFFVWGVIALIRWIWIKMTKPQVRKKKKAATTTTVHQFRKVA